MRLTSFRFPYRFLHFALLAFCLCAGAPSHAQVHVEHAAYATREVAGFHDLISGPKAANLEIVSDLYLPAGVESPGVGPFPAMVILHGSGGEWGGRGKRHAALLTKNGIAALVVDTFKARNLTLDTGYIARLKRANLPDQIADAFAALAMLKQHPKIDADRIGVLGYSMGGVSALLAAHAVIADPLTQNGGGFSLHIGFYPPCFATTADTRTTGAEIVTLWGTEDKSTHRQACETYMETLEAGGSPVEIHWMEGAVHAWNSLSPGTFFPTAPHGSPCNYVVNANGTVRETVTAQAASTDRLFMNVMADCTAEGYSIAHNGDVDAAANRILLDAIRRYLP
ncbi:hypothetical protein EOI86_16250 [Hwanghaeella grinnelliae]|uniref:Dienelactone hydrolase domain-containing protein n=1 Tax=Hwanghaeella grinnelliae TaxID=2500179 RepID=A0A3S2Y3A9_9PROT|nr:dienelactone hydrolase family protein [Hwanghaeella grinnelliae]RVU36720.1 hypothetical protein EOI86_16250 [Hwanghaeella grinnelliae]